MSILRQTRISIRNMSQSIRDTKSMFRKQIKDALSGLSEEDIRQQSAEVTNKALRLEEFKKAKSISVFLSMPNGEISTREIVLAAFRDRKKVFVPYIHGGKGLKAMDMLQLRDENDFNSLQPDAWGIPSLDKGSISTRKNALGGFGCVKEGNTEIEYVSDLDLIFMPGIAFDQSCNRLGHGKGFYDRYLTTLHRSASSSRPDEEMPCLVGLALREQLLPNGETLPVTDQDWKVDIVVATDY